MNSFANKVLFDSAMISSFAKSTAQTLANLPRDMVAPHTAGVSSGPSYPSPS